MIDITEFQDVILHKVKDRAYYRSGIVSPGCHEIKGVDSKLWSEVKLE